MKIYNDVVVVANNPVQVFCAKTRRRITAFNRGVYEPENASAFYLEGITDRHDTAFWYYDDWNTNFGHYLMDHSHDILQFEALSQKPELITSSVHYVRELLALRGIQGTELPCDFRLHYFKQLLVPEPVCAHGTPIPESVIQFFREIRDCAKSCTPPVQRLVITRQDSDRRRMTNESDLIAALVKLGFMPYTFGTLPLNARISLVRRAKFVFTMSGAGACNHAWIQPGAMTITLYHPNLMGEEGNNSRLTRAMGGFPVALDHNGSVFSNGKNSGGLTDNWMLTSVETVTSEVLRWMVRHHPCT